MYWTKLSMNVVEQNWKARVLIGAYDRNTSIMMRLEVNYLVIPPHIMLILILNYLIIAQPTLKCSRRWIVQASLTSWTVQTNE